MFNDIDVEEIVMKLLMVILVALFLLSFSLIIVSINDTENIKREFRHKYASLYDVSDVDVFLRLTGADWLDFENSPSLRKAYESVRDGHVSLIHVKK